MEQPSLRNVRNRVEWKSDNYGIKETTSIETGRRGGMDWSLTYVWWTKIRGGYLRSKESQSHTRPPSPEYQCSQEDQSPQLLAAKTSWG